jgi:hypothetical protein
MAEDQKPPEDGAAEPAKEASETTDDPVLEDAKTDRAVDDIVEHEGDEVLAAEDAAAERAAPKPRRSFWRGVRHFFGLWFGTSKGRWLTFILLVAAAGAIAGVPKARYGALNMAGVQAGASVAVVDELTQLPLKNVQVSIGGHSTQTQANGRAVFTKLRLGQAQMTIDQPGFSSVQRKVVVGWGSNPLGSFELHATGVRFVIVVHDLFSDKPLAGVLATSGDATALSDETGKIELTLESVSNAGDPVTLRKDGYRNEQVTLKPAKQDTAATMLTSRKAVFVSKASGKYDLYKSDADGANREVLLPGTGNENGNITLVTSGDATHAAVVSTRDNQHDADGYLLSTLTLVDVGSGTAVSLAHAEQVQLIDWIGSRLIFQQVSTDAGTSVASRNSVIGYDYVTNSRVQLAAAPKLNAVFSAQGAIYYAIAANDNNGSLKTGFYKVNPDGSNRQAAYDQEVWSGLRTGYNTFALQTADGWTAYSINNGALAAIDGPASYTSRLYSDNADHTHSLWESQGALLNYDVAAAKDATVQTQNGLTYPLHWLNVDAVIYRLVTSGETADYVSGLQGGVPHKIADVANTYGFTSGQ